MKVNPSIRKSELAQAYLGHRLTPSQLESLTAKLELPEKEWKDEFERSTQVGNQAAETLSSEKRETLLRDLGLQTRFEQLSDNEVWTAEARAVYRRVARAEPDGDPPIDSTPNQAFYHQLDQNFDSWDRDGNLRLESQEIDFVMSGGFYGELRSVADEPQTAVTLALLRRYEDYLGSANPSDGSGVSRHDLSLLMEQPSSQTLLKLKATASENYDKYLERAEKMQTRKNLEEEEIDPVAIRQGVAGSCVFLSTLGGLPKEQVESMLSEESEGRFVVKFADGVEETVVEPTVAERLYHAKGQDLERWPALFELALAQRFYQEDAPKSGALRTAIDGMEPERVFPALTQREADRRNLDELTVLQTKEALSELLSGEGPVICGSRPNARGDFISVEELHNGVVNGHAYTILGFDSEKESVTLSNPWGKGEWLFQDSDDDGDFDMPLRDFYSSFRWVAGPVRPKETSKN